MREVNGDPYYNDVIPPHVPSDIVFDYNIYDLRIGELDPYASIKHMREIGLPDIFWTRHNGGHWICLGGNRAAELSRAPNIFATSRMFVPDEKNGSDADMLLPLFADPPRHSSYRKVASAPFTPARIAGLEDDIRTITKELISNLYTKGGCEFVSEFSLHMPIIVFLKLVDLPLDDRLKLHDIAAQMTGQQGVEDDRNDPIQKLAEYLQPILEERRKKPGNDVLSGLTQGIGPSGSQLSREEATGMASLLLLGGLDSVAVTLGHFAAHLADHPEQRQYLIAHPEMIGRAAEEMLRRFPPTVQGRVVTEDVTLGGVFLKKNDHVTWASAMYNLDDRLFANPLEVDFERQRAAHFSFGHGVHFCLGRELARLEFKIFLEEWLRRIPDFRVKPGAKLKFRTGVMIGLEALPLEWELS